MENTYKNMIELYSQKLMVAENKAIMAQAVIMEKNKEIEKLKRLLEGEKVNEESVK